MAQRSSLGVLAVAGLVGGGAYLYSKRKKAALALATSSGTGTGEGQGTGEPEPPSGGVDPTIVHWFDDGNDQPPVPPGIGPGPINWPGIPPKPPGDGQKPQGGIGEPTTPPSQQDGNDDEPVKPYCKVHQFEHTYEPATPKWTTRKAYNASLFTVTPVLQQCKKWKVVFGVCLKTAHTFGLYDALSPAQRADVVWHIRNTGGEGINFDNWKHPNIWKAQMKGTLTVSNGKLIPSGFVKVTNAYEKGVVDPCPNFEQRWPKPANDAYLVLAADNNEHKWKPFPSIEIYISNMTLQARVAWAGFPSFTLASAETTPDVKMFNDGHQHAVAYVDPKIWDETELMVKVWAAPYGQSDPQ